MATITIEVTDLVQTLTEFQETHDMSDRALGFALGVSKNTPHNWRSGREMNLTPELQDRIARLLQITPPEVLELHGYDLTSEVPSPMAVLAGDSPRSLKLATDATYEADVLPFPVAS